jgi:hypothetical protein
MNAATESLPVAAPVTEAPRALTAPVSERDSDFNLRYRQAKALASSDLVPQAYRDKVPNVMLALDIADRVGAGVFAVMQNLHLIQGRPSWSSTFLIATVNHSKRFTPLRFEVDGGNDPTVKTYRVRAYATDIASKETCYGAWITWKMVDAEGWSKKTGSKWLTMPEQMFLYRAAAFWARIYAPEVSVGLHTVEETTDRFGHVDTLDHPGTNTPESLAALKGQLLGHESADAIANAPITYTEVEGNLRAAQSLSALEDAADLIREIPDADQRAVLNTVYGERKAEIERELGR